MERDHHSSLLGRLIIYRRKKFYKIGPCFPSSGILWRGFLPLFFSWPSISGRGLLADPAASERLKSDRLDLSVV